MLHGVIYWLHFLKETDEKVTTFHEEYKKNYKQCFFFLKNVWRSHFWSTVSIYHRDVSCSPLSSAVKPGLWDWAGRSATPPLWRKQLKRHVVESCCSDGAVRELTSRSQTGSSGTVRRIPSHNPFNQRQGKNSSVQILSRLLQRPPRHRKLIS